MAKLIRPATSAFAASSPFARAIAVPNSTTSLNGVSDFCALAGGACMMLKRFVYSSRSGSLSASKYSGGRPNLFGLPILDEARREHLYTRLSCFFEQDRVLVPASSAFVVFHSSR